MARVGQLLEARSEAQARLAINPTFTIALFHSRDERHPTYLAGLERLIDGLRKAGVTERAIIITGVFRRIQSCRSAKRLVSSEPGA